MIDLVRNFFHFAVSILVLVDMYLKITILSFTINIGANLLLLLTTDLNNIKMMVNMIIEAGKELINIHHKVQLKIVRAQR